jgi:hypothetical protein
MRMRSELRLSGHPGQATESQHARKDDPWSDSATSSFLSSHEDIIGTLTSPVQHAPDTGTGNSRCVRTRTARETVKAWHGDLN